MVDAVGKTITSRALVAADDSEFWLSLRRELPEFSERLLSVRTGRDCLRAIESRDVRLVVLDNSLQDVRGTHLVHLVRQIRSDLGIVLTYAESDQEQEREARQSGILYYGDRRCTREIAQVMRKSLGGPPAPNGHPASNGHPAPGGRPAANGSGAEEDRCTS